MLVPGGVAYGQLETLVQDHGGGILESLELFDIYAGKGISDGFSAYGIRLKFRSAKGSLKGKTVDGALSRILGALSEELGVHQRTS